MKNKEKDEELFQNNLILLKEHKIPHISIFNRISGLFALCRIFNESILKNGDNSILSNKHYCVKLSINDIYEKMSKRTQKKYLYYQKGTATINAGLLRHDIRLLIIADVIRKVDFKDLTKRKQAIINNKKKEFFDDSITDNNIFATAPYYEVLDLRKSHLERLTKIKNKDISSYAIVQQLYGDRIADNCFGSVVRDYKNGLLAFGENSFLQIINIIKNNGILSIKDLSEYCAHKVSLTKGDYKKQTWWYRQLRTFNFSQYGIKLCKNSELNQEQQLDIHGNNLVLIAF